MPQASMVLPAPHVHTRHLLSRHSGEMKNCAKRSSAPCSASGATSKCIVGRWCGAAIVWKATRASWGAFAHPGQENEEAQQRGSELRHSGNQRNGWRSHPAHS
eukprot:361505-Chlamydomonas_euryale.AAC.12